MKYENTGKAMVGGLIMFWILSVIGGIALNVGIILIAWHFIAKYW
jgi:hypothetical protein